MHFLQYYKFILKFLKLKIFIDFYKLKSSQLKRSQFIKNVHYTNLLLNKINYSAER